jgi:hypothetical protein
MNLGLGYAVPQVPGIERVTNDNVNTKCMHGLYPLCHVVIELWFNRATSYTLGDLKRLLDMGAGPQAWVPFFRANASHIGILHPVTCFLLRHSSHYGKGYFLQQIASLEDRIAAPHAKYIFCGRFMWERPINFHWVWVSVSYWRRLCCHIVRCATQVLLPQKDVRVLVAQAIWKEFVRRPI